MKVTTVSANVRYSQDTGKGAWKVIELGAEGSVDARETWQGAQAYLYAELGKQLKELWAANGTLNVPESHREASNGTEPTTAIQAHFCPEHQAQYQLHRKGESTWYSHKAPDGEWCREEGGS